MSKTIRIVLGIATLGVAACGGASAAGGGKTVVGAPLDATKIGQIKKGETTKAQVQELMGDPFKKDTSTTAPPECNEFWSYVHGVDRGSQIHVDGFTVAFNPSGVVCETASTSKDQNK